MIFNKIVIFFIALIIPVIAFALPKTTSLVPSKVYIPIGFDSNDSSEIVIEGQYMNSCYRSGLPTHTIDEERKKITVYNKTYVYENDFCLMVIVGYSKVINLGLLKPGNYSVHFDGSERNEPMGMLPIAQSTAPSQDDYLYAPVDRVTFKPARSNKAARIILHGRFTNSCMSMDTVKVHRGANSDSIAVLPVAKMGMGNCHPADTPFNHEVSLEGHGKGRVLLHVRSLNGQSINNIVNLWK
ncbi:MAG: hypothetical protein HOO06_04310 [Bdellovibrionaceae bacterium]|jgi:hypothetical protein|nr:hypothetical protein [Pseudobdellovibrionaceae bacterium]